MAYSNFQNTSAFLGTYEAALKWFRPLIRPLPCMLDVALQVLRLKKKKKGGGVFPVLLLGITFCVSPFSPVS